MRATSTTLRKSGNVNKAKGEHALAAADLPVPTPWPNANARLLGLGAGLPVAPLQRLAQFDDKAFERLVLEWAHGYLAQKVPDVVEVQQRGGAGDKGRDIVALNRSEFVGGSNS